MREALGLPDDDPPPKIPGRDRKAPIDVTITNGQEDVEMDGTNGTAAPSNGVDSSPSEDVVLRSAQAAAAFIPSLSPQDLLPPKLPTKEELEGVLLDLRKKALVEEYFGE